MSDETRKMNIRFSGHTAERHKVPAMVLNQVLAGLQRSIYILAMDHEGVEVRQKERVTGSLQEKYALLCEPLREGSLMMTAELGDPASDLFGGSDIEKVARKLQDFAKALHDKDEAAMRRAVADRDRRKRLTEAISKVIPRESTGMHLEIGWNGVTFLSSRNLRTALRDLARAEASEEEHRTVTGRLMSIDFDARKITILYPPTGRELECLYEESAEELLLENPRELIQVTGVVLLDEQDQPKRIVDADEIRGLDLSRFYRETVDLPDGARLRFDPPLILEPQLVEDDQLIHLADEPLGIDMLAPTIEELAADLPEEIGILWRNYAMEVDEHLSPKAQEIKSNLKNRIREEAADG